MGKYTCACCGVGIYPSKSIFCPDCRNEMECAVYYGTSDKAKQAAMAEEDLKSAREAYAYGYGKKRRS